MDRSRIYKPLRLCREAVTVTLSDVTAFNRMPLVQLFTHFTAEAQLPDDLSSLHLPVCAYVCPSFHGSQATANTPVSHLMCSSEIPFEYCSSELMVAKGTAQTWLPWGLTEPEPQGAQSTAALPPSSQAQSPGEEKRLFFSLVVCLLIHFACSPTVL
ncbi:hypothetical protein MG293_017860 [Ovis ammon polii]|uniref:Uncharacterized protein n=1 Tax=Ovis ammon polii TaxID=230172 RepID=A0AAD4TVV2_OVIAM|nr:hypothetical protein MG293_017860 [Ovis ammon polii]